MAVMFVVVAIERLPYARFHGETLSLDPLNINMQDLRFAGEPVIVDPISNPF